MSKVSVNLKLRPLKLAFLVHPSDSRSLSRAIELNSILWGGTYNPIIPTFSKIPSVWKKKINLLHHSSKEILGGYVETFDPDFIVPLGKCKKMDLKFLNREIIDDKEVEIKKSDWVPGYGIGIFEVLQGFFKKEFKFKQKYPPKVIFPIFPNKSKNFFRAIFGFEPSDIHKIVEENWKESLDAEATNISFENYLQNGYLLNIRKILNLDIETKSNFGHRGECVFLMDANNVTDIIDFWNLRAIGWKVLPVAIQSSDYNEIQKNIADYIDDHSGVSRHNFQIYYHCSIVKSRSISEDQMTNFVSKIKDKVKEDNDAKGSRFVIQNWYPRMWDEWARDKDGVSCCDLEVSSKGYNFDNCSEALDLRTIYPEFIFKYPSHDGPRYANDVSVMNFCDDEIYAEVIPEVGENLYRTLSYISFNDWRFSKRSQSYLAKYSDWSIHIKIPKAEEVFVSWMKDNGLNIKLSTPGRIAKQMIKQLGGIHGTNILANENLIQLLKKMETGKELNKKDFFGEISKITTTEEIRQNPSKLLEHYINKKIFQLGFQKKFRQKFFWKFF
jgi:hypothetical protein